MVPPAAQKVLEGRPLDEVMLARDEMANMVWGVERAIPLMSSVPENWIPMIPVHIEGDNRETQLQRASMLRILTGDTNPAPDAVKPRTSLLRQGLEETPAQKYLLHEEEVPRAGTRVTKSFQRTRWRDGRAWVWLGVRKQTGRGEGSSGLAFDRIIDIPPRA